ncbi:MAG: arylesterase [Planctomycetes bacterium]|nr:arylesterase [Planctomycetota bacterium]
MVRLWPRSLLLVLASALTGCGSGAEVDAPRATGFSPESLAGPSDEASTRSPAAPEIPAGAPRVVFLGDSIAAGLHLEPAQAFPAVVQRLLAAEGRPFELVNAGVSGDTSAGGLRRIDWLLKQAPDVLVLELGGNDGLRGQPVAEIEARLRQIVERAEGAGVRVLLLGVRLPPSLGREYVSAFEALYPRLAEELELAFVPSFMQGVGGVAGMMLDDGLHPSRAGHARIGANVAPAMAELLGELAPATR